jgi:hypothetical protein
MIQGWLLVMAFSLPHSTVGERAREGEEKQEEAKLTQLQKTHPHNKELTTIIMILVDSSSHDPTLLTLLHWNRLKVSGPHTSYTIALGTKLPAHDFCSIHLNHSIKQPRNLQMKRYSPEDGY